MVFVHEKVTICFVPQGPLKGLLTLTDSDIESKKFLLMFAAFTLIFFDGSFIFSLSLSLTVKGP